jgi:predicted GNAT family acetyltransferase
MTNAVTDNPARSRYELAREQGLRITARCSFVAQFIERNPQYQDLLQQP